MPAEERVLCFERKLLDDLGAFQGLSLEVERFLPLISTPKNLVYRNRAEAELDRRYKQVIPYVIITSKDRVLQYRRGTGGEETRLHGKFSIGIGGHISDEDHGLFSQGTLGYFDGMRRELKEEVEIEAADAPAVAVLNDDSTDVGYVHFGIVHIVQVPNEAVAGHRKGIVAPEFISIQEAVRKSSQYESWSSLCLQQMNALLSKASPAELK